MNAGRELDALVAMKVLGAFVHTFHGTIHGESPGYGIGSKCEPLPYYSVEIVHAFALASYLAVQHVRPDRGGSHAVYGFALECEGPNQWRASFGIHSETSRTAPHAICLAALKAVEA